MQAGTKGRSERGHESGSSAESTSLAQRSPFSEHRDTRDRSLLLSHLLHSVTATDAAGLLLLQVASRFQGPDLQAQPGLLTEGIQVRV